MKKYILFIIVTSIILGVTFLIPKTKPKEIVIKPVITPKTEVVISKIKVDIKGAVKNPGVYELESGKRVNDAILLSGGLLKTADTKTINLSKLLTDEMVIIVYTKEEVTSAKEVVVEYIEKECICEAVTNDACLDIDTSPTSNLISLNNATEAELDSLPGIGLSKATDIINYRVANNGFKTKEELMEVSGIGEAIYNQIKDLITL